MMSSSNRCAFDEAGLPDVSSTSGKRHNNRYYNEKQHAERDPLTSTLRSSLMPPTSPVERLSPQPLQLLNCCDLSQIA